MAEASITVPASFSGGLFEGRDVAHRPLGEGVGRAAEDPLDVGAHLLFGSKWREPEWGAK
jgi:hypothetical protein